MKDYAFGNRVCHLRVMKQLSQKMLGQRLGVTDKAVSRWETGASKPRGDLLQRLAACLDVRVDFLLGGPQAPGAEAAFGSPLPETLLSRKGTKSMRMNLIPQAVRENGNYLCTWSLQKPTALRMGLSGSNTTEKMRDALTAELLFGSEEWYHPYPREERAGLYLLLDDGWDVPFHTDATKGREMFGSVIPDPEKFPHMGDTPVQRLSAMVRRAEQMGYAGLGLWISPQEACEPDEWNQDRARAYWEERARWCHEAGVKYWKVDWGRHDGEPEYREMMTACVRKYAPNLLIEHAVLTGPLSTYQSNGEFAQKLQKCLAHSDFLRTYDVCRPFADVETFFRANALLGGVNRKNARYQTKGNVNAENCAMVAAGLGLHLGVMSYEPEILACLRWQRLSPPFSAYDSPYLCSEEQVTDRLFFDQDPATWVRNRMGTAYELTVPAIAARGTALPVVRAEGEQPIVLACQHPKTGAYALVILRRNLDPNPGIVILADITIMPSDIHAPIGIFGRCRKLTIRFGSPVPQHSTVWAQCLLNDEAVNVTEQIHWLEDGLEIDGHLLRVWGHDQKEPCAVHEPVVLLRIL